jgi:integrase
MITVASIKRRSDGKWRARYRDPLGKEHARHFDRKADAERWVHSAESAKIEGSWIDPNLGRLKFSEWAEQWRLTRVAGRPSSRARDESYLRTHIVPVFGQMPLAAIRQVDVQRWVSGLTAAGKAATTVTTAAQLMAKIMRSAVSGGLIKTSPCIDIDLPKIERDEMRFLNPAEVTLFAAKIDPRYRALVLVGAYGGFRIGEMVGLKRTRVDPLRRRIDVVEICTEVRGRLEWGAPKTRAGRRSVTLPGPIMTELVDHMARFSAEEFVFPAPEGGPLRVNSWRRRFWNPAVKAAGLAPLRPHDLRHTAVALWIASGANMLAVSRRAGHASTTFTLDRYGHLFPDADEQLADALSAMIVAVPPEADADIVALRRL